MLPACACFLPPCFSFSRRQHAAYLPLAEASRARGHAAIYAPQLVLGTAFLLHLALMRVVHGACVKAGSVKGSENMEKMMFPVTPTVDGSRYGTQCAFCGVQPCVMCSTTSATACRNVCALFCCNDSMPASVRARVLTCVYSLSLLLRQCFRRIGTISPMPPSGAYNSGRLPEQVKFASQMQRMTEPVWHICLLLLLVCHPYTNHDFSVSSKMIKAQVLC